MENRTEDKEYVKPSIVDHGDLTDLTALLHHGNHLDATFVGGTPLTALTISGP